MNTLWAMSPMRDVDLERLQPEPAGKHREEHVGVEREEQHLEDRVERDQSRRVLGVALGQFVPDDDHGDAAREADQDQARPCNSGWSCRKTTASTNISTGPITQFCTSDRASTRTVAEHVAQVLVADLGQRRVHHQDQADGDRDVGGAALELAPEPGDAREQVPDRHAGEHREEDPQGQVAVEKAEPAGSAPSSPHSPFAGGGRSRPARFCRLSRSSFASGRLAKIRMRLHQHAARVGKRLRACPRRCLRPRPDRGCPSARSSADPARPGRPRPPRCRRR